MLDVFDWAGELRKVEIAKDGFQFQFRQFIETGMADVHRRLVRNGNVPIDGGQRRKLRIGLSGHIRLCRVGKRVFLRSVQTNLHQIVFGVPRCALRPSAFRLLVFHAPIVTTKYLQINGKLPLTCKYIVVTIYSLGETVLPD